MTYKKKLFLNFLAIFTLFTLAIIVVQYNREKTYKIDTLKSSIAAYTTVLHNFINEKQAHQALDSIDYTAIVQLLPKELRVTMIDAAGVVLFDNIKSDVKTADNHLLRPEVSSANINTTGSVMRTSATTGVVYYYQATYFKNYFIRLALPYNINVQALLKGDNLYIYLIFAIFIVAFLSLLILSDRMGQSLAKLRDFAYSKRDENVNVEHAFPSGELGDIGAKLVENFKEIKQRKEDLMREKDKLILHFSHATTGIAFFSSERKNIYSNALFVTHLNAITDKPTLSIEDFFATKAFARGVDFLDQASSETQPVIFEETIEKNRQYYTLRIILFQDKSIEVILDNVTALEKNRLLKQEMTSNIAHELRTPVCSISGYIETLMEQKDISPDKMRLFIERCFVQTQRLSSLICDISIITQMELNGNQEKSQEVNLNELIEEIKQSLSTNIQKKEALVLNNIPVDTLVVGNETLLYAIFRNLIENALTYAGGKPVITAERYFEDAEFCYFSVWDNGVGVGEEHLTRLLDRFYRVSEGRARNAGGSGLGLSIVKNAVLLHQGTVTAKNRKDAGLEIQFSIKKKHEQA